MPVLAAPIGRRRALAIVAASGCALLPGACRSSAARLFEWRGTALGAEASIRLYGDDRARAEAAIRAAVEEIERLEREFSLYRPESALSRLNREGVLDRPSIDMLALMRESRRFGELSSGAFDVTVQPLWELYARHFAENADDVEGPAESALADAVGRIDYRRIEIAGDRISLAPGTRVTLNGIAQGYITDRVADLLEDRGWSDLLIDLGELRALGGHPDGRPWRIELAGTAGAEVALPDGRSGRCAAATSAASALRFDRGGRHHHLFVPQSGRSARGPAGVTVLARRATDADALSTALAVAPPRHSRDLLRAVPGAEALVTREDGRLERLGS